MEQYSQYLMWLKSKYILNSPFQAASVNSFNSSWEEQAFAEDSHGPLGGFIWPPRSYSCSFCKREFRSAQALGGHMNVHRRDRARLKQSLSPPSDELLHQQNHTQFPSYPCTSNSNPSLPFMVSSQENFSKHNHVETDLSMGLNLAVSRNRQARADGNEEISYKRQKTAVFPLSFFLKPCSNERLPFHSEVLGLKTSSMEDIDLELRLGDSPTVK